MSTKQRIVLKPRTETSIKFSVRIKTRHMKEMKRTLTNTKRSKHKKLDII